MLDDDQLEKHIRDLLVDICEIMYAHGYEIIPVGAMMRLIGVSNENAAKHDTDYFALDKDFEKILKIRKSPPPEPAPKGVTLH